MDNIVKFVEDVTAAMGLKMNVSVAETADGLRVDLDGKGGEMLTRRRGEALSALQHLVSSAFRDAVPHGQRIAVDCQGFRQDKDTELKKMALFLAEKARTTKTPQEMGPLNPYERRLVHVAVADLPDVTSESIGDAFMKTVIIATRN
jgi:spoIIIJ-associated protein